MKVIPYGDNALLVQFNDHINLETSQQVIALYQHLNRLGQFTFLIPAYNSLTVGLDRKKLDMKEAEELILSIDLASSYSSIEHNQYMVPVCYEGQYAPDMEEVKKITGLTQEEIITEHCSRTYHVYMLGFLAGFAYMGSLPKAIQCARKDTPRLKVPAGSVGLAGLQTGIYPTEAPGGWQLIGTTPIALFNPELLPPNYLNPGDQVRFRAISEDEFKLIKIKIETGIFRPEIFND